MQKKLVVILFVLLIGGYFVGNQILNSILANKVESALQSDTIQKEIDKLTQSTDIEKELSNFNPEELIQDDELTQDIKPNEDTPKQNTPTKKESQPPASKPKEKSNIAPSEPQVTQPPSNTEEKVVPENQIKEPPQDSLQFATKNEAIEFVRKRFTSKEIAALYKIYTEAVKDGLTPEEKAALKEKAYEEAFKKFTPQEIAAVKKIILGEG